MQISSPHGFQKIVVLTKTHRVVLPKGPTLPVVFRAMNPMPVSYTEFPIASRDHLFVFVSADQGSSFVPVLVLGLAQQQNLYITLENAWDPTVYLPAYVRRYPFCMTRVTIDGKEAPERVACVEKRAINAKGERLFDDSGNPLPEWEQRQKLLFEYETDLARTDELCKSLAQYQLLEPFTMQAVPDQGEPLQLTGMYRVSEAKLTELDGTALKDLLAKGVLGRIYAHLLSLDNFQRLLGRRAAAIQRAGAEQPSKLN